MPIKLPEVDRTKLHLSYKFRNMAWALRRLAEQCDAKERRLRREHYNEQYDRCRACDGHGSVGEGLGIQTCSQCNNGLLPKGTIKPVEKRYMDW